MSFPRLYRALAALVLAGAITGGAASSAAGSPSPASGCAVAQIVVLRGTGETSPYASGESPFVDSLVSKAPVTVDTYGVPYMATTDWDTSVKDGISKLAAHMVAQEATCPDQRFVLMGYSQGAWVVDKALAGWSKGSAPAISAGVGAKIVAVVIAGDPRFRSDDGFNRGTYTAGVNGDDAGWAGRLSAYAGRTVDYCQSNDYVCQLTPGSTGYGPGHIVYMQTYSTDMVNFALSKLPTASSSGSGSGGSAGGTGTANSSSGGSQGSGAGHGESTRPTSTPSAIAEAPATPSASTLSSVPSSVSPASASQQSTSTNAKSASDTRSISSNSHKIIVALATFAVLLVAIGALALWRRRRARLGR